MASFVRAARRWTTHRQSLGNSPVPAESRCNSIALTYTACDAMRKKSGCCKRSRAANRDCDLPPRDADPGVIRQVWCNLIGNALKYSAETRAPKIVSAAALTMARPLSGGRITAKVSTALRGQALWRISGPAPKRDFSGTESDWRLCIASLPTRRSHLG